MITEEQIKIMIDNSRQRIELNNKDSFSELKELMTDRFSFLEKKIDAFSSELSTHKRTCIEENKIITSSNFHKHHLDSEKAMDVEKKKSIILFSDVLKSIFYIMGAIYVIYTIAQRIL